MKFINKKILIISPENWGEVFLSKHHYALELAKENKVWFLNAKGNRIQKKLIETTQIKENLIVINYYNLFYGFGKIPFLFTKLINGYLSKKIKTIIGELDIVWSFEQAKFFNLKLFQAKYTIFHPVDHIPFFNNFKNKLANSSDIILSVSEEILDTININKPKCFINHGISEFDKASPQKLNFPIDKNKINVAYIGNINIPYLDIKNLIAAIEQNSHCNFHFIGPTTSSNLGMAKNSYNYEQLIQFQNVYFQGVIEQVNLIETTKEFDILISCYDYKKYPIRLSNSHKILEYLSTGKVVVSNYFPIFNKLDYNVLIMVNNNEDFATKITEVAANINLYNSIELANKRILLAKNNSYSNQLKKIEQLLTNLGE